MRDPKLQKTKHISKPIQYVLLTYMQYNFTARNTLLMRLEYLMQLYFQIRKEKKCLSSRILYWSVNLLGMHMQKEFERSESLFLLIVIKRKSLVNIIISMLGAKAISYFAVMN